MPLDQVLSSASELSVLQDLLDLILLVFINYNWWGVGCHSIVLVGLQQSHVEDIVDASQCLPVPSSSKLQAVSCLPYLLRNGEWSNQPVMQFLGALESQVSNAS